MSTLALPRLGALPRARPTPVASPDTGGRACLRRPIAVSEGLLLGVVAAILAGALLPPLFDHKVLSVLSGSMEPAIGTGDAILVRQIAPRSMRIGDVVTFRDPANQARLITHRVRGLTFSAGTAQVITKGDANTGVERWSVPLGGEVGLVRNRLPRVGQAFVWTRTAPGRLLLLVVPATLLAFCALRRIWRTAPTQQAVAAVVAAAAPAVSKARSALARDARSVTVAAPECAPGDRLSAVVVLGDQDVAFLAPLGWALHDDRSTANGRLLRYESTAERGAHEHTFHANQRTSISISIVGYGVAA